MLSFVFAFIFGFCTPLMASRFGKFLPTDLGTVLASLWHCPRCPKCLSPQWVNLFYGKWRKLLRWCFVWACLLVFLFYLIHLNFDNQSQVWVKALVCILALLTVIDDRYFLLPDVLTIPLLFLGFGFSIWGGEISSAASFWGSVYGYLLPSAAVLFIHPFIKDSFGGGDVKMLTALGAWFGFYGLNIVLLISVVSFFAWSLWSRRRSGAYGPHLAFGSLVYLFISHFQYTHFF